ncbi:unnamed protein product [Kluyveromyces dobzhanskii CBS 2104]|uniref:pH-response transcription factor pacC/RIM101 n=1 Tax=Kluyveromyces dobzhanskii CBS 2104 TaxID=1427455 RepID=A0A0A8L5H1_9SACH|nr:unnamed protein product [Kluyveromyces dobzhanskii CBS 2104]
MAPIAHLLNTNTGTATDSQNHSTSANTTSKTKHSQSQTNDCSAEEYAVSPLSPRTYPSPRSNSSSSCDESRSAAGIISDAHADGAVCHHGTNIESSPLRSSGMRSASTSSSSDEEAVHMHRCKWEVCDLEFTSPELLYHHLCQDHVGRKSQKNLQLNCQWGSCQTKTVKRDHITSHLRVHVPLKPFACSTCKKMFKRPQDLKKHLKVHNEELSLLKKKRGPKPSHKVGRVQNDRTHGNQRFSLPSISLGKFIDEDIKSQPPVYSQQLAEKMAIVLLLPVNNENNINSNNSNNANNNNNTPSPSSLSSSSSSAASLNAASPHIFIPYQAQQPSLVSHGTELRSAVGFFNNLSMDMSRNYANNTLPTPTLGGTPIPAPHSYPLIPKLPSISASPNIGAPPPILPVFNRFDAQQISPSASSSAFYPQHYSNDYGIHQRTALCDTKKSKYGGDDDTTDLDEKLASMTLHSEEQDAELFKDTYSTVNLLKDYLLCELMEELDEFNIDEPEAFSDESRKIEGVLNAEEILPMAKRSLPKYPQVVI